jgi:hypothetical protein
MDCDIVQEKVAAVSAVASETGFELTAFSRQGVAGARDGVRQSSGTEAGKLLSGNPLLMRTMPAYLATKTVHQLGYKAKDGRSGLAHGRGHGAIGTGTGHLCAPTLTYSVRKTPYDTTLEVGASARSCRAGGCAASPRGAGTRMTSDAESIFEMTTKIAGELHSARITDVIVLHL